ncbi:MAG TPA: thiamine pyrophosphate-dependent enzyme, partial [Planctomycetota bacterium]|nr:thiamine pyrophosphate-dependent enzyme [Planctomycetota bacterium]
MTTRTETSHDIVTSLKRKAIDLVESVVEMTSAAGSGHPTSASSLAHVVTCLLYHHMRYDPARPDAREADRLVLSEGHACPIVYAAAADIGIAIGVGDERRPMTTEDALTLRDLESPIDGHPNPAEGFPFFPAATGSLGQGLSVAAGLAIASRLDALDRRVFAIMGDGESREGQIWEALELIRDQRLAAVCPIFNANGFGQTGPVAPGEEPSGIRRKLEALGYECVEIDGHDPEQILDALEHHATEASEDPLRLVAIIARTVKGWGFASKAPGGRHGKAYSSKDEPGVLAEIEAERRSLGATNRSVELRPRSPSAGAWTEDAPSTADETMRGFPRFRDGLEENGEAERLESGRISPRRALGLALRSIAKRRPDVVVLDGDVSNSTYTELVADDPELSRRFVQCYIAEQNMISCAAGLAAGRKIPVAATFGKFVVRGYDQLELALISRAGLKIIATHTGVTPAADGPSQMALADVAFFRAWSCVDRGDG